MVRRLFRFPGANFGILVISALWGVISAAQDGGGEIFKAKCSACHSIGKGRLVGPDLAGVGDKRTEAWAIAFIKSPQAVIASGDPVAKALFDDFKMMMPDQPLSDEQIKSVLAFIKQSAPAGAAVAATTVEADVGLDVVVRGRDLFQGKIRFSNGGPSCISCHNVETKDTIGGGILAKELTTVYSRAGAAGLRAIMADAPFPVMKTAFQNKEMTEDEIVAVVGFLKHADKENTLQQPREYGWAMFGVGVCGVALMFGLFSLLGSRRKRGSVNDELFARQVKSESSETEI